MATPLSIPNCTLISSAVVAQLMADSPYTSQWAAHSPLKTASSQGGSGPRLTHGFIGPAESILQTASQSVHRFCRAHDHDRLTDRLTGRQTDHATPSVTIGHIEPVLRCGLKLKTAILLRECKQDAHLPSLGH